MHACMHHHHIQTHIHQYTYIRAYMQPDKLLCAISLRQALAAQSPPNLAPNSTNLLTLFCLVYIAGLSPCHQSTSTKVEACWCSG
jgi:hypothetical protein